jgi:hypothetical protein
MPIVSFDGLCFSVLAWPFKLLPSKHGATRWRSRLRRCATSQKVAGSVPVGVIGIFL